MFSLVQFLGLAMMVATVFATFVPKGACDALLLGQGPSIFPDTPEAFQAHPYFSDAATSAATPAGYVQAYSNLLTTYDEPSQFVHYVTMDTYNVDQCATECDKDDKCNAFTIFFERHPVVAPDFRHCPNPRSTTHIKCDLWSGTIRPTIAVNHGQIREKFRVVLAGSNAYVKDIVFNNTMPAIPAGYAIENYAFGAAIEAPLDCNGKDTYMGLAYWPDGHFDAQRCITSCEQTHDATGRQCHFVNTYMERRNNVPVIQHCAMFSGYWPAEFATNVGQTRGNDEIDISDTDSYGIRHITNDFSACLPVDKSSSAASDRDAEYETTTLNKRQLFPPRRPYRIARPPVMTEIANLAEAFSAIPTETATTLDKRQLFPPRKPFRTARPPVMTEISDLAAAFSAIPTIQ